MSNIRNDTNYYEVLEVPEDAPQTEVHRAYQLAKATYSQDNPALYSMFSPEEARELLRLIEEAYSVLGNPGLRKQYDLGLRRLQSPASAQQNYINSNPRPTDSAAAQRTPISNLSEASTSGQRQIRSSDASEDVVIIKKNVTDTANGNGRTAISNYHIDAKLEVEIGAQVECDGAFLQKVRLYKNIPLERLSENTRIGKTYLLALEANDYKSLPAPVFTRGFVIQVAKVFGLDENKVATSYMNLYKAKLGK